MLLLTITVHVYATIDQGKSVLFHEDRKVEKVKGVSLNLTMAKKPRRLPKSQPDPHASRLAIARSIFHDSCHLLWESGMSQYKALRPPSIGSEHSDA